MLKHTKSLLDVSLVLHAGKSLRDCMTGFQGRPNEPVPFLPRGPGGCERHSKLRDLGIFILYKVLQDPVLI